MTLHKNIKEGDSSPVTEKITWPPNLLVTMAYVTISAICERTSFVTVFYIEFFKISIQGDSQSTVDNEWSLQSYNFAI